jgi:RNA polymerase sigma-70 factor (ECF subfamily)
LETDDETLLAGIRNGDARAFDTLVRRHTARFYALAYRFTRRKAEAEDIVQQAFVNLWERPGTFQPDKNARFTTWFHRVIINASLNAARGQRNVALDDTMDVADNAPLPDARLALLEEEKVVERAIARLPERQRVALNLSVYEGLADKEAAAIMNVNVKAFESLLSRARTSLRKRLAPYLQEGKYDA